MTSSDASPSESPRPDAKGQPITQASLARDLSALGVAPGQTLLVHAAMSRLGWVFGGTQAIIAALLETLGPQGTLLMPTHSSDMTEPSRWQQPPVPAAWLARIRAGMPTWDPDHTPTRQMGALAEAFRSWRGVRRSGHPYGSFAALGPAAELLTAGHEPGCAFGEDSPIGALNRLDGGVLLLGVGHGNNTSLHLAEYRATWAGKRHHQEGSAMMVDGARRWVTYTELVHQDDDFLDIGAGFDKATESGTDLSQGLIGAADSRLMRQRPLVDFATRWMNEHRE